MSRSLGRDETSSPTAESSTRHWLDPSVGATFTVSLKTHGPSDRDLVDKNGRSIPLQTDMTTDKGELFGSQPQRKDKALLLDITTANPCASAPNWIMQRAMQETPHRRSQAEEEQVSVLVRPYKTLIPLLIAMSACGEAGPDVHALIRELGIRRVQQSSEIHSDESRHMVEGTEVICLRWRFSFVLQQALSFRKRHHLCRQGVKLADTQQLDPQGLVDVQTYCTEVKNPV